MLCSKCGLQIPDNSKFCPSCGNDVQVIQSEKKVEEEPVNSMPVKSAKNSKAGVIVIGILAVLLLIGNGLQYVLYKNSLSSTAAQYEDTITEIKAEYEDTIATTKAECEKQLQKNYDNGYSSGEKAGREKLQEEYSDHFLDVTEALTDAVIANSINNSNNARLVNTFIKVMKEEFDFEHYYYFVFSNSGEGLDDESNYSTKIYGAYEKELKNNR